jgi:hypothetical protein
VHKTIHIRWLAVSVAVVVRGQGCLEGLEVLHPFYRKIVGRYVSLVEDKYEWKFRLIQDAAGSSLVNAAYSSSRPLLPTSIKHI